MNNEILSLKEFAQFAKISKSRAYKAIQENEVKHYRRSQKLIYIKKEDALNWMFQGGEVATDSELESRVA